MASLYTLHPSELAGQDLESWPSQYEIVPSLSSNTYQSWTIFFFPEWNVSKVTFIGVCWLGSRVRLRSLALTRPDTKAEGYYLNSSSQLSKLVSPMFTILKSISHKHNDAAASQRNRLLPTINSLPFWKVAGENFQYHFIFFRDCLFSKLPFVSTELPICYLFKDQSKQRFSFDNFFTPKDILDYWQQVNYLLFWKPKVKMQLYWSEDLFCLGISALPTSQAEGC